jgi:hypothetical protein
MASGPGIATAPIGAAGMHVTPNDFAELQGVNISEAAVLVMKWLFREQTKNDYGIDAHLEIVEAELASGQLIALQIKSGTSHFREWDESNQQRTLRSDFNLRPIEGRVLDPARAATEIVGGAVILGSHPTGDDISD